MTQDLVIIGCGGFGREVADVVDAINQAETAWNVLGFLDDNPSPVDIERVEQRGLEVLGNVSSAAELLLGWHYSIGIGNGAVRETLSTMLDGLGGTPATLVHPTVTIGANSSLEPGAVACSGVAITNNVVIGRHVHINLNSTVGHDTTIRDFVTINPLVAVSGNCVLKHGATLGTHSAVLPGLTIGTRATVGASACVTKNVPDGVTVKGVPAR